MRAILKDTGAESEVRREIERHIVRAKIIATSSEIPLSADSKRILHFAAEEADRLAQRHISPAHMLLGILRVKDSLGARVARARGLNLEEFREMLAKSSDATGAVAQDPTPILPMLEEFLRGLTKEGAVVLMSFFSKRAQVVDAHGRRWSYDQLAANFETVFAPYAKKNATYHLEETVIDTLGWHFGPATGYLTAIVLWKNSLVASMERVWIHRMSIVVVPSGDKWAIVLLQVTPVQS